MNRIPESPPGVTGLLLVGGASRRFGSPKALAELGGKTLAAHGWEALAWCDERLAVGKRADRLSLPFPIHDDRSGVRAPLAGLVAGLRLASHDLVVVLERVGRLRQLGSQRATQVVTPALDVLDAHRPTSCCVP